MRILYTFLFYLALPFIFIRLLWRSRRLPDYRTRLTERLGYYPTHCERSIWIHAVSVGETVAAIPLIKSLLANYPHLPLVVTTMTPTGAARVKALFGDKVIHAYLPYDLPGPITRFLQTFHPVISIIMETELWPNLFAHCHKQAIPVCLVNARLSEKSARGYARVLSLTREMLQSLNLIAANNEADKNRFIALGADPTRVMVTGNIKFDLEIPDQLEKDSFELRAALGNHRFIWIAASTHEGEEEKILAAHALVREKNPQALLILVPRHPDRFASVASVCEYTFKTQRRSAQEACHAETAVYLGDTMGELLLMYGAADVAFVGGSLIPHGGHNILEPAALGKPIITGCYRRNFQDISDLFLAANALKEVQDATALANQLIEFMQQPSMGKQCGERALQAIHANRGALAKQLALVGKVMACFNASH